MNEKEAEIKIKAAAYAVADSLGKDSAVRLLEKIKEELKAIDWSGPGWSR